MIEKRQSMMADENGEVAGFMCATDWDCEIGAASGGSRVFPSTEDAEENLKCIKGCGLVEVRVRFVRTVKPGSLDWIDTTEGRD